MLTKVLKEAEKWIGYLEKKSNNNLEDFTKNAGHNNYTIFAKQYKQYFGDDFQAQPWCAMFVSCVFRNALGADVQKEIMPYFAYCPTGVNQFKNMKNWYTTNPQVGDVIFFKDASGVACHVGIVWEVSANRIFTIEGNTSGANGVVANGGGVHKKSYSVTYDKIMGYGRPKYKQMTQPDWQKDSFLKLTNRGFIQDKEGWSKYGEPVLKSWCIALIDKITGGKWDSPNADSSIHWAHPHLISLYGKGFIQQKEEWENTLNEYVSKGLVLALVDKSTGAIQNNSQNVSHEHWAYAHLNSLCNKGIIHNPEVWCDDFQSTVSKGHFMALLCKAYKIS